MRFGIRLGLIAVCGLALGLAIRPLHDRPPERAVAALELFETICVPFAKAGQMELAPDLPELVPLSVRHTWADPKSQIVLELTSRHCSVSDVLVRMNSEERAQFASLAEAVVASEFPTLTLDENHGLIEWDEFRLWAQFDRGDSRRWGVTLSRHSSEEPDAGRAFDQSETVLEVRFAAW